MLRLSPYHRRLICEELEDRRLLNATAATFQATGTAPAPSNWTVLIYLDGDNSLESWAKMNVQQMEQVGSTSNVNIVAQFDRGSQATQNSYGNFFLSWYGCRRAEIIKDPNDMGLASFSSSASMGDVDMGSSATLTDFIQWAVTNYPANHYLLDIWDHGYGIGGVCEDDSSDSILSLSDVQQAIASAGTHMDVIGFDACLMAMTETAHQLQSLGDVMVASEGIIPSAGWPYNTWLADLSAHTGWTAAQVGADIVQDYDAYYDPKESDTTLSTTDLASEPALATSLDSFSLAATNCAEWSTITAAREVSQNYDGEDYLDLGTFLQYVANHAIDANLRSAAATAYAAYQAVVMQNYSGSDEGGTGLSIYLPAQSTSDQWDTYTADNFLFVKDTHWKDFLTAYISDSPSPPVPPVLSVSTTSLTLPSTTEGTAGGTTSFTVTGSGLGSGDAVSLLAPSGCEISQSSTSNFAGTLLLYPDAGNLPSTVVYARIDASATADVSGNLLVTDTLHSGIDTSLAVSGTVEQVSPSPAETTVGLYDPTSSMFMLRNTNDSGFADECFCYGVGGAGMLPIAGDWNGSGIQSISLYDPATSTFYLEDSNSGGDADDVFVFGPARAGYEPVVGDWNGDGRDSVGLYDPATSTFYLRNTNSLQGPDDHASADIVFSYGPANSGMVPVAGDWDGSGRDGIGLYDPATSTFYLRESTQLQGPSDKGYADATLNYGVPQAGVLPIAGDWNGDGRDGIGLYNQSISTFFLRNALQLQGPSDHGFSDVTFMYGQANHLLLPVAGDWTGVVVSNHLVAAGGAAVASPNTPVLTQDELPPIVNAAITRWTSAGLDATAAEKLRQVQFVIGDLPGSGLGEADGNVIHLDANAAGNGWFVDATPTLDEEFASSGSQRQLVAVDPRVVDRMDLLTVVEHELGHIAGANDLDALTDDVMSGVLGTGIRRNAVHTDAALAS
jgi:hypothetical protein